MFKKANGYILVIGMGIPFGIGGGLLAGTTQLGDASPWPLMVGFVAGVVWLYVTAIVYAQLVRKSLQPKADSYMLGNQRYEIDTNGLQVRTKMHEALFRWDIVAPPIEYDEYYFVMIESFSAFIIPKRCFGNESDGKAFADRIRDLAKHSPY